jgi:GNAT superfamily N-acetyltransferase
MKIETVTFDQKYLPAFVEFNREWIEKHFVLEPMDLAQLEAPQKSILEPGGEIFFVLEDGAPVATCAMVPHGEKCYELAKMAVSVEARGRGYGDVMMKAAIEWARNKGARKVTLLSNTVLAPAISLYAKHGFKTVHLGKHPDYDRCNIEMSIDL